MHRTPGDVPTNPDPPDLTRIYRLDDDPPPVPDGYALASCDGKGGMRLVRRTPEDEQQSAAAFALVQVHTLRMTIEQLHEQHNRLINDETAGPPAAARCAHLRWRISHERKRLYVFECVAHDAGVLAAVTALSPEQLEAEEQRCGAVMKKLNALPAKRRRRFYGRTLGEIQHVPTFRNLGGPSEAHAPRSRSREHRPGATRRTASSSSTSSSDPPPDSESEPPPLRRLCAAPWCKHPVSGPPNKVYCGTERCDQARAKERKRQSRLGVDIVELERREALENARRAGYIGHKAFAPAGEHALSFLWGTRWSPTRIIDVESGDPGELDARALWIWCRCNGHHIDDGDGGCFRCGHWRGLVAA